MCDYARVINFHIIIIIIISTLGIYDPDGFGNKKIRNKKCEEWHLIRAVIIIIIIIIIIGTISASRVCGHSMIHQNVHVSSMLKAQSVTSNFSGSTSTRFKWIGHFMHTFVTCLFQAMPTTFHWNQFIVDRHSAEKSSHVFWHTVYLSQCCCFSLLCCRSYHEYWLNNNISWVVS